MKKINSIMEKKKISKGMFFIPTILVLIFLYTKTYSIKKASLEKWKQREIKGVLSKKYKKKEGSGIWYFTIKNNDKVILNNCDFSLQYAGNIKIDIGDSIIKERNSFFFKVIENTYSTYEVYKTMGMSYRKAYKENHWINPKGWNGKIE